MEYRIEHDSMGEVKVPTTAFWGAQTQRSLTNFTIGEERMPLPVIYALASIKKACCMANAVLKPEKMTAEKECAICDICDEIIEGKRNDQFPLRVWQTGSGTQTNMNVNEVIAVSANLKAEKKLLHPNDDVNMSQSSNDVFPTAMHVAAVMEIENSLLPAADKLIKSLARLEEKGKGAVKTGRTHLQDATPIAFSQEVSGWKNAVLSAKRLIETTVPALKILPLGGTAVGTGLNAPEGFDKKAVEILAKNTGKAFSPAQNTFKMLTTKDELVTVHGAMKGLACNLMKIANDIRMLASGPRCGLGEITIPANEPGSSIMPGKVNPTQCEAITMIAVQVMANDVAVGMAASQGNFELNVFMPVMIYNFLQSVRLLSDGIVSFTEKCVDGIEINRDKMKENLDKSLMLVTALNPYIGYENAAKVAHKAYKENISLKEACLALGFLTAEQFDRIVRPEEMV